MNKIQQKILDLARVHDIKSMRRVDLVELTKCEYPSQITHHMNQLIKRGDLVLSNGKLVPSIKLNSGFFSIPVLGEADCGEATKYADGSVVDNLIVSPSLISSKHPERLYSLIARGDSMNAQVFRGKLMEDGDFLIVEKIDGYEPSNGDVVVSNIGGLANVKAFKRENERIVLLPNSTQPNFFPIFIDINDEFIVEGKVVDIIKAAV